jgi:hypothetical protein
VRQCRQQGDVRRGNNAENTLRWQRDIVRRHLHCGEPRELRLPHGIDDLRGCLLH